MARTATAAKPAPKAAPKPAAKPLPKKGSKPAKGGLSAADLRDMREAADEAVPARRGAKPPPARPAAAPATAAQPVPLSQLRPWPGNPRRHLGDLTELAASLRSTGLLQPLVVRPHPTEPDAYEIAAGHRRHGAAQLAELPELLVIVRPLTDRQMLEVALTENGQREGVHPLEEASALHQLHHRHHVDVEELAAKLGRSKSSIYQRLALMRLTSEATAAYEAGRLSHAVALRLARLPEATQREVLDQLVVDEGDEPRSLQQVGWTLNKLHLKLAGSPFALDDDTLPGGSCLRCPKRSGHQPALFSEAEGPDLCLDQACHKGKVEANKVRVLEQARADGHEVLDEKASKEVLSWGGRVGWDQPYVDLDAEVPEPDEDDSEEPDDGVDLDGDEAEEKAPAAPPPRRPTWREVLGDVPFVLAQDNEGRLHKLVKHDVARDALPPTAPAELHQAVAPQEEQEEGEPSWKKEAEARKLKEAEDKAKLKAIVDASPVLEPRFFRAAVACTILAHPYMYRADLEELGLFRKGMAVAGDEQLEADVLALPVEALWRIWLSHSLDGDIVSLDQLATPGATAAELLAEVEAEQAKPSAAARTKPLFDGVPPAPAEDIAPTTVSLKLAEVPTPKGGWREARRRVVAALASAKGSDVHVGTIANVKSLPRPAVHAVVALLDGADAVVVADGKVEPSCSIDLARISEGLWRMSLDYIIGLIDDAPEDKPHSTTSLAAALELPRELLADICGELEDKRRIRLDVEAGAWRVAAKGQG